MPTFVEQLDQQYGGRFHRSPAPMHSLAARTAEAVPPEPVWSDAWEGAEDAETAYSVRFLTFVYQVPFRLVAVQQELMDVFGYRGKASKEFLERFQNWSEPQRAAFRSLLLEHQRLSLLRARFQAIDRILGDGGILDHEERASIYATALEEATQEWNRLLADAEGGGGGARLLHRPAAIGGCPQLSLPLLADGGADSVELDFVRNVSAPTARRGRRQIAVDGAYSFHLSREEQAALPPDDPDIGERVLDALAEREVREAERRFQARVRWLLSLTKQQRTVVAHRALGGKRRETAERMGISEESVKTHLQRADAEWDRLMTAASSTLPRGRGAAKNSRGRQPALAAK